MYISRAKRSARTTLGKEPAPDMPNSQPDLAAAKLAARTSQGAFVVMALTVVLAGAATPGYDHAGQFISELGAREAPREWIVRLAGFLPAGALLLAFCVFAHRALPGSRGATLGLVGLAIFAAGYVVAAAFPLDPKGHSGPPSASAVIHEFGGVAGYLFAPGFLFLFARAARTWPAAGSLAAAGYVAAALALLGLFTLSPSSPLAGLSQRLLELAVLGWAALCGRYAARRAADGA
jgi:hypothetical protein